jgi:hypothetical protein
MHTENKVSQEIIWGNLKIQLFRRKGSTALPYNGKSNIIAIDSLGAIVWKAEDPRSHHDEYFDMEIDKEKNVLKATTGLGYRHLLSLENGKVLNYYLIK